MLDAAHAPADMPAPGWKLHPLKGWLANHWVVWIFELARRPLRDNPAVSAKQVADAWKPYYDGPAAPFWWEPDRVEVLDSGTLALSTGPVHDPQGQLIGIFNSIWRLEAPGKWRIVFDKGGVVCGAKQE